MSAQRLVLWVLCALACLSICDHFTAQAACPSCFVMEKHPNCTKDAKLVKSRDGCPGGVKYEHCGCCKVCLKLKGESCRGGQHAWEGFCDPDQNLECSASGNETGGICVHRICSKNCTKREYDPVCGSDGRWYRNNCARRQHNNCDLSNDKKVKVAPIRICDHACEDLPISEHGNVNYSDGILHGSIATFNCDFGYLSTNPLLTTARCFYGNWTAHPPKCVPYNPCTNLQCSAGQMCVNSEESGASCVCRSLDECSQDKGQTVCGSDGRTYPSRCHLEVTACNNETNTYYKHAGNCLEIPIDTTTSTQGSLGPPHTGEKTSKRHA